MDHHQLVAVLVLQHARHTAELAQALVDGACPGQNSLEQPNVNWTFVHTAVHERFGEGYVASILTGRKPLCWTELPRRSRVPSSGPAVRVEIVAGFGGEAAWRIVRTIPGSIESD